MSNPYAAPISPSKYEPPPAHGKPDNYLVHSILVTLCCCLPLGIVAIVFAAQVDGKWNSGDYQGAQSASNTAKLFCWISFGLGLASSLIGVLLQLLIAAAEMN